MDVENKDLFERHLKEVKAKVKTNSFDSLVHRMRAEQRFRKLLLGFGDYIHSEEIMPFLVAGGQKNQITPDFLLRKAEFKMFIFLTESQRPDRFAINRQKLGDLLEYLKSTELIELILVSLEPSNFPAVTLTIDDMQKKLESTETVFEFANAEPFTETLTSTIKRYIVTWPVPEVQTLPDQASELTDFENNFKEAFIEETTKKRPSLDYKKEALDSITARDISEVARLVTKFVNGEIDFAGFRKNFELVIASGKEGHKGHD